jgi:hypothetical protein
VSDYLLVSVCPGLGLEEAETNETTYSSRQQLCGIEVGDIVIKAVAPPKSSGMHSEVVQGGRPDLNQAGMAALRQQLTTPGMRAPAEQQS